MNYTKKHRSFKKLVTIILIISLAFPSLIPTNSFATDSDNSITVTYPYYAFVENPDDPWETVWDALDSTDTINYSDSYFDVASPGDHPKLRTLSYALALAGFENLADGYPSSSTTPNPKLLDFLNQLGFSDYQSWDTSSETDGHSMGTTIGHKTLSNGKELIVIAPRNYNYMTEWLSNFNVGTEEDHKGFTESANYIIDHFNQYLANHDYHNYKVWVVGYSRGGAVIDLFAKHINANINNYSFSQDDFYVYTFGAPRASLTATNYPNIHDVKDGNDLLLGYVFPKEWGFYNTGTYEEIHPADLEITTSVIDISDLADSSRAANLLQSNNGLTKDISTMNGREFMDSWTQFVNSNGLTREYFDSNVKAPLSAIMKAYQLRTLDKQSEFTNFIIDTNSGMAGMVARNALYDLMANYGGDLDSFPTYIDLVKVLKGTATDDDVNELITKLTDYMDEYANYESKMGKAPDITESEFAILKENLPKLVKALSPIIIADAKYTQSTFGENYSLYYTYTLVSNAEKLVIGHIPESLMPILKSLIPADPETPPAEDDPAPIPNTGFVTQEDQFSTTSIFPAIIIATVSTLLGSAILAKKKIQEQD